MQRIFGIDPGPETSGFVDLKASDDGKSLHLLDYRKDMCNWELMTMLESDEPQTLAIERVRSYMQRIGNDTIDTAEWVGRFDGVWMATGGTPALLIPRKDVLQFLFGTTAGVDDASVRAAGIEAFGGTPKILIGTKKEPGPLYGVSGHAWQALGVAIVAARGWKI